MGGQQRGRQAVPPQGLMQGGAQGNKGGSKVGWYSSLGLCTGRACHGVAGLNRPRGAAALRHAMAGCEPCEEQGRGATGGTAAAADAQLAAARGAAGGSYRRGSTDMSSLACSNTSQLMPAAGATLARLVSEPCRGGGAGGAAAFRGRAGLGGTKAMTECLLLASAPASAAQYRRRARQAKPWHPPHQPPAAPRQLPATKPAGEQHTPSAGTERHSRRQHLCPPPSPGPPPPPKKHTPPPCRGRAPPRWPPSFAARRPCRHT